MPLHTGSFVLMAVAAHEEWADIPIRYISHLQKTLPTLGTTAERRNLLPCFCQL